LNSDALVTHRSWHGVVSAFAGSDKIAVVGPSTSETPTGQCVRRAFYCRRHWSDKQICSFAEKYVGSHKTDPPIELGVIGGFAFFMRRKIWDHFGGFDVNLSDYGNETELCKRMNGMGYQAMWTKSSYIHHLGNESYGKSLGLRAIRKRCLQADDYIRNLHASQQNQVD
jgi:GT2 family glycosyltransferase